MYIYAHQYWGIHVKAAGHKTSLAQCEVVKNFKSGYSVDFYFRIIVSAKVCC